MLTFEPEFPTLPTSTRKNNQPMTNATLPEIEESTDLNLSLEELDAILESDVVNSIPPFINI